MRKTERTSKKERLSCTRTKAGMLAHRVRQVCLYSASAVLGQSALIGSALAAPQGGQVTGGAGAIHQHGNTTEIHQGSRSLAIDWQSFDISRTEVVDFLQPSSSAVVLNRILDQNPSRIMGKLTANGRVFLLNPNGILFGKNAQVNVGSLMAGTMDMSTNDFMNGRYNLATPEGKGGAVINRGLIEAATGGSVTLVGDTVINEGTIRVVSGQVNLAAGRKATLDFNGDGLIRFEVSGDVLENAEGYEDAVLNTGTILADGGQVLLTASAAGGVFTNVVNNTGVIRAGRIDNTGGVVRLVGTGGNTVHSGSIDVSGQDATSTGGTVHVLGDNVGMFDNASIDASGATGGGTVLVGGDYQGNNPNIQNAEITYVGVNTTINADATESGDGGTVIVWADGVNRYYGNISARAASQGGNGGFAEVSGKRLLDFRGDVDLGADNGIGGTLLLDPLNITISTGADTNTAGFTAGVDNTEAFTDDAGLNSVFDITAVTGSFDGVGNGATIQLEATNDITVANNWDIAVSTGNTDVSLILNADNNININADLTASGTGTITLSADNDASGAGDVSVADTFTVATGGGALNITANDLNLNATGALNSGAGVTSISSSDGDGIGLGATQVINGVNISAAELQRITATGLSLSTTGAIQVDGISAANSNNISGTTTLNGGTISFVNGASIFNALDAQSDNRIFINTNITTDTGDMVLEGDANNSFNGDDDIRFDVTGLTVTSAGSLTLDATTSGISAAGTLTLNADDGINVNDSVTTVGNLALDGDANNSADTSDDIQFVAGVTVASTSGSLTLDATTGGITGAGALTLSASTGINLNDALSTGGTTSLTSTTGDIALADNAISAGANNVNVTATAGNITVAATATADITTTGTVTLTGGAIGATNTLDIDGAAAIVVNDTGAGDISIAEITASTIATTTLTVASATSGNLDIAYFGGDVVNINNGHVFDITTVDHAFNYTATAGNISQIGASTMSGAASYTASAGAIDLTNAGNDFSNTVSLNNTGAGNVAITDTNAIQLAASSVGTGTLTVNAVGITQAGAITQAAGAGAATFNGGAGVITLTNAGNDFIGPVSLNNSGPGNVSITDTNAINLGASGLGSGAFTVNAVGITQVGGITQSAGAGAATFNAGAAAITLTNAGNDFTGPVVLNNSGLNNVAVTDSNAIDLGVSSVGADLAVTAAGGDITNSGALTVAGNSTFTAPGTNSIMVDDAGNAFTGTVQFVSSGGGDLANVAVADTTALDLQALTLTGNLTATGAGITQSGGALTIGGTSTFNGGSNAITLNDGANDFTGAVSLNNTGVNNVSVTDVNAIDLGTSSVGSGALTVNAVGVTQSGAVTQEAAAGAATFNAGAGVITLTNTGNDFTGAVSLNNSAGNVAVTDTNAINLGASSVAADLAVIAGGDITNSGALTVPGNSTFTAPGTNSITVGNAGNAFTGTVQFASAGVLANVTVVDTTALDLQALTLTGNLSATGAGITQSGILDINGTSTFNGGANAITLANAGNDFTGAVSLNNSGVNNVAVTDTNAIDLGASSVGADLTVIAGGDITDSGTLTVAGNSTFTAPNAGSVILDDAGNAFTGTVQFVASAGTLANVTVVNTSALDLQALSLTGNLSATGAGITQSGDLLITGTSTFNGGANAIALANAGNDFTGAVSLNNSGGGNVAVTDINAIDLAASSVGSGTLTVNAVGITQSGAVTQAAGAGTATFNAGAGVITLANAGNDFTGAVSLNNSGANNVTVTDTNAIDLGASSIGSGSLTVNAVGITQSGAITQAAAAGAATFNAGAGVITLGNASNDFTGAVSLNNSGANNVTVTDANAINLGASSVGSGTLTVNAVGITQTGAVTQAAAAGAATFNAGAGVITLTNVGNDFTGAVSLNNTGVNDVSVTDTNAIDLGASTVGGDLAITAGGDITDSGTLTVAGNSAFTTTGGSSITLDDAGNAFTGTVQFVASAGTLANVTVVDTTALDLQALALTGNLSATGAGLTQSGALTIAGTSTFNAGANAIDMTNAGNDFVGAVSLNTTGANNADVMDMNNIDLGASSVGGTMTVIAASGAITDSGAITANSLMTVSANGTTLDFGHAVGQFNAVNSAGDIVFNNTGALTLTADNIGGDITVTNTGTVRLNLVSALGNVVSITANGGGADILNNNGGATNIEGITANLTATDRIGVSEVNSITLDVIPLGAINLTFGAAQAFINNINLTPVTVTGGGLVVDFNTLGGLARDFSGKAQDTELTDVGFVDWSLFDEDLSLFGVVEPGIKMPKDQIEDDLVLKMPEPDVPLLMKTARGWEFMWTYNRTAFDGLVRPEAQHQPVSF